jgi:integrase
MQKPRLYQPPSSTKWWADFYVDGRRVRKSTGTADRREAMRVAVALAKGEQPRFTVREALEARRRDLERRFADGELAENTLRSFRVCKAMLLHPEYGLDPSLPCDSITPDVLADWKARQADRPTRNGGRGYKPWTFIGCERSLRAALKDAHEAGKLDEPVHERLRPKRGRRTRPEVETDTLTDAEVRKLLKHVTQPWLKRFLTVAQHCGPRIGELLHAERARVRFERDRDLRCEVGVILVDKTKTRRPRTLVLVNREAIKALREQLDATSGPWLWPRLDGEAPYSLGGTQASIRKALKKAKLYKRGRGVHSLRRTFISNLIHDGAAIEEVAELIGHQHLETTAAHYIAHGALQKRARAALRRLSR